MGRITIQIAELIRDRERREGRHLTLSDVAQGAGLTYQALSALAANRTSRVALPMLAQLCEYFQCTPAELLHYEPDSALPDADAIDSRDIVARWEQTYGADEHPPER